MPDPDRASRSSQRLVTPGAVLMTLAALIVAALAARDAAVQVTANRHPELAVRLAPANATAITRLFDKTILSDGGMHVDRSRWINASRQALRADPLNASGIRLLAYTTEIGPDGLPRARRLMQLAERVSRRDVLAQIWLIEDAVRQGDIDTALRHYDRALLVRPVLAGQFFPILMAASSEPAIREGLVPYLRADRVWARSFLSVLVERSTDPLAVIALFQAYGGSRAVPSHAVYEAGLLRRLARDGRLSEARALAVATGAGRAIDAFGFTTSTTSQRFRPLTWSLYEGFDGDVALVPGGGLSIKVRPETKIVAASRIILPSVSRLLLRQRLAYPAPDAVPTVTWRAYCRRTAGPPQQFWVRDLPTVTAPTPVEATIEVPRGCAGVQIDLEAVGLAGSADSQATIDRVELATR